MDNLPSHVVMMSSRVEAIQYATQGINFLQNFLQYHWLEALGLDLLNCAT
jgi:hypothetical protein